jgi:SAM-dependent methyltransferase
MRRVLALTWIALRAVRKMLTPGASPFNLDDAASPAWEERARVAAALVALRLDSIGAAPDRPLRIADFGAGTERLDPVLAATLRRPYTYAPFDLIPQSARVQQLDVSLTLPEGDFDIVFCLGLLEYIEALEALINRLAQRYPILVLSYVLYDAPIRLTRFGRRCRGWLTHYTRAEMEAEFARRGLAIEDVAVTNDGCTAVWLLRNAAISA